MRRVAAPVRLGKKAKKNDDHYSDPLDLTTSLAMQLASVVHVRQVIVTSRTYITSPQGSPGDAKNDLSHRCAIRTMGEVKLSSALAPLSRCRIPSPLAGMPSIARRRIAATLSARRRAENVASSSLGVPVSTAALRTVTSKWSMSMTCMGARLGGRGLTYGSRLTHVTRRERQRGRPPTLYRAGRGGSRQRRK